MSVLLVYLENGNSFNFLFTLLIVTGLGAFSSKSFRCNGNAPSSNTCIISCGIFLVISKLDTSQRMHASPIHTIDLRKTSKKYTRVNLNIHTYTVSIPFHIPLFEFGDLLYTDNIFVQP